MAGVLDISLTELEAAALIDLMDILSSGELTGDTTASVILISSVSLGPSSPRPLDSVVRRFAFKIVAKPLLLILLGPAM